MTLVVLSLQRSWPPLHLIGDTSLLLYVSINVKDDYFLTVRRTMMFWD